jgi:hypothetical protein
LHRDDRNNNNDNDAAANERAHGSDGRREPNGTNAGARTALKRKRGEDGGLRVEDGAFVPQSRDYGVTGDGVG